MEESYNTVSSSVFPACLVYLLVTMAEKYDPNLPPASQAPVVDPYGFILNPQNPAPKKAPLGINDPFLQRLLLIVGGAIILIILIIIVVSVLFGGKNNTQLLLGITQSQQEILRVTRLNPQSVNDQDLKYFTTSVQATIQSDQSALLPLVKSGDKPVEPKILAVKADPKTDELLTLAESTNTYDTAYRQVLEAELLAYQQEVQMAHKDVSKPKTKELLERLFKNAGLLREQLKLEEPTTE